MYPDHYLVWCAKVDSGPHNVNDTRLQPLQEINLINNIRWLKNYVGVLIKRDIKISFYGSGNLGEVAHANFNKFPGSMGILSLAICR